VRASACCPQGHTKAHTTGAAKTAKSDRSLRLPQAHPSRRTIFAVSGSRAGHAAAATCHTGGRQAVSALACAVHACRRRRAPGRPSAVSGTSVLDPSATPAHSMTPLPMGGGVARRSAAAVACQDSGRLSASLDCCTMRQPQVRYIRPRGRYVATSSQQVHHFEWDLRLATRTHLAHAPPSALRESPTPPAVRWSLVFAYAVEIPTL
jgi:hypothetical protein